MKKSPYDLACAFVYNYERPASIIYGAGSYSAGLAKTQAERDATRANTRKTRGECAEKWYDYLTGYCTGAIEHFNASNFIVGNITSTGASVSFVVQNGVYASYALYKKGLIKQQGKVTELSDKNFVTFSLNNLVPNTDYWLTLTVFGENDNKHEFDKILISTPQDCPSNVTALTIEPSRLKLPTEPFIVKLKTPSNWGYWRTHTKNDFGYRISLIINGSSVQEIDTDVFSDIKFTPATST